ncbi:MAG: hypothetical protein ACXADS_16645 [Candidatus Thorarchaeota archaeon]
MKDVWLLQDEDACFGVFLTAADAKKAYAKECKEYNEEPPKWEKIKGVKNVWRATHESGALGGTDATRNSCMDCSQPA